MKNPRHFHIGIKTPKKRALSLWLALITPLVCAGTARAEGGADPTGNYVAMISAPGSPPPSPTPCSSSNGGLNQQALSESGVPAPSPGFFWSEVQHNAGNNTQANTNAGYNVTQGGGFRLADNFTISQACTINNVVFYGYLTAAPATPSPFTAYTLQIHNGRPGDPGVAVIFGNTTTNRLASSVDSTFYRIFNTVVPPPGTAPGTTRKIWRNTVTVGVTLPPGTYWLDWASTVTGGANHFAPSKTIAGARGAAGDNARQFTAGAWVDVTDVGTPTGGTPVPQDFPFDLNGTPSTVTPTPSPTVTVTPSATPTVTPGATPTPTPTLTPPPPPVITSPLVATGTVGLPFTYQFEATGATSLAVSNLPPGLVFNSMVRAIAGNPITSGAFPVILSATNSGGTTNRTLNITVQSPPPSGSIIVSATAATGRTGRAFSFQLQASRGTSVTRFTVDSLPPGLNLDSFTGFISGTPTSDGSFSLAVSAIDGAAITRGTLQLTFTSDPTVPIMTSPVTVTIARGQFFTYTMTADANGTYGYIGNDGIVHQGPSCAGLPAGLCFDGDRTISGTFNPPFGSDRGSATQPNQTGGIITNVEALRSASSGTGIISVEFSLEPSGAGNIATRLAVGTGENVLIGGFIIQGNAPEKVVIRAVGPSLTQVGVPNALQDSTLELRDEANVLLASNDNWTDSPGQATQIIRTGLQPSDDREAAIVAVLHPGGYTAVVRGKNNSTGIALVEVYDLGTALVVDTSDSQLANIATRGTVLGGDSVMIGGFIIRRTDTRVVVRAIGPSLTAFGISGALPDPNLELKNVNGATLIGNDDWESDPTQAAEIQQRTLAPTNPRESALVTTLPPGSYTAIVSGKGGATGVAVVEGYVVE